MKPSRGQCYRELIIGWLERGGADDALIMVVAEYLETADAQDPSPWDDTYDELVHRAIAYANRSRFSPRRKRRARR
jgi:hypothetical protein